MTARLDQVALLHRDEVVAPPAIEQRACEDRTFGLPPALHIATAMLFLGFVTVLCAAFATPGLLLPYAVFVFFISAFFYVPAKWARMNPRESRTRALSWAQFLDHGIDTMTGRTPASEATALVLTLPILIFGWAVAIAIIAAVVR